MIGIIAILTALVLSVLTRVRGAQKSVRCIANLRGIGEAFQAYVHDSKGHFPDPGRADLAWEQMLLKYYRGSFSCEGDTELYPAVGSSYDWRDTGRNETSLAGRLLADVTRADGVLAFEALPGWHARRKINVVRVDGSATQMEDDACFRDLLAPIGARDRVRSTLAMRILVAEDHPSLARSIANGLREEGYAVDLTMDGEEALHLGKVNPYDCIVLDLMLPKRDGWSVITQLRRAGKDTPVICLTARDGVDDAGERAGPRRRRLPRQAVRLGGAPPPAYAR